MVNKIPDGWRKDKFEALFIRINTKKFQIQRTKYKKTGQLPVIDQGQSFIVAYTDEVSKKFQPTEGIIVFGDHTRFLKYVTFDFVVGADGTQLIDTKILNKKFGYYLLLNTKIQNLGYSRHFKLLTESTFIYPPKSEQDKIAEILTTVDENIEETNKIIAQCENIKKGMMHTLFTTGIPNKHKKFKQTEIGEIPEEWIVEPLGKHTEQLIVPMRDKPKRFSGVIPWCRIEDFNGKYLYDSTEGRYVDESIIKEWNLKVFPKGTVICSCSARLGVCAIAGRDLVTNQTFIGIIPKKHIEIEFLYYLMTFYASRLQLLSNGTTIAYLSREQFERFMIVIPSLNEQKEIVKILNGIDNRLNEENEKQKRLSNLKKSLMQKLLSGEMRVKV
ncbi:MAG TPA: restriction endonuclease subunit S [Acidobacteriota bacterium]|nr:restriction endonuclease subunit S [Acidobacteriota bacterium]